MPKIKKVYRIENVYGRGPFGSGAIQSAQGLNKRLRLDPYDMPCPNTERWRGGSDVIERHLRAHTEADRKAGVFAFPTMKALRKWFSKAMLRDLGRMGYHVVTYVIHEVNNVEMYAETPHQCVFLRSNSTRL